MMGSEIWSGLLRTNHDVLQELPVDLYKHVVQSNEVNIKRKLQPWRKQKVCYMCILISVVDG